MLSLQAEAISKGYMAAAAAAAVSESPQTAVVSSSDGSLSALQNLQPWSGPYANGQSVLSEPIC